MKKEFEIITDIYNDAGKCLKKDISYCKVFETDDMELEQYIDAKGKVISKYSGIIYRDKYYKINVPYTSMKEYLSPLIIKGFIDKMNKSNEKNKIIKHKITRTGR